MRDIRLNHTQFSFVCHCVRMEPCVCLVGCYIGLVQILDPPSRLLWS